MGIITLTTDLGDKDIYQAALKGSILKVLPTVNIVDITHNSNKPLIYNKPPLF
jgi:S-adenosylmethionine hydrolase